MAWPTEPGLRRARALLAALTLTLVLAGCNSGPDSTSGSSSRAGRLGAPQARRLEQRILDERARAVRDHDPALFLRHVDQRDHALVQRQRTYFDNLEQLPIARLAFRAQTQQWSGLSRSSSWGRDVRVPRIVMTMQLQDFDAVPVQRTVGLVFSFRHGRATIVSDRTRSGRPLFEGTPAPWDLTAVTVHQEPGVLGVFDRATSPSAATVMGVVRQGIDQIDRDLPFSWSDHVVVYSVADPHVLGTFTDVPGGALDHLGAMTFPTYAAPGTTRVASTRILLMPSSVRAGEPFLGRITRHELSHVAIGPRDDGAPAWFSEGLAEYLGARDLSLRDRIIPTSALGRAQTEDNGMPASRSFNDSDQEWHYALAWMACDYIASSQGESRLWELMDALHDGGSGTTDAEQDRVLVQVLGYDSRELARRAAARIRHIYG